MAETADGGRGGVGTLQMLDAALERCARCGASFRCGAAEGSVECWCVSEPHVPIDRELRGCLCRACLGRAGGAPSG